MYYLLYGLLYGLSLLPLRVLYLLSDLFYLLAYYVLGYRKQVVMQNLAIAFPDKTAKERVRIAKNFYRGFTDFFIETIKLFSAGDKYIREHFVGDYSVFEKIRQEGRKSQMHLGHNFHWELGLLAILLEVRQPVLSVYMPLTNPAFDRIFRRLRSKRGGHLLPATDMRRAILPFRNDPYLLLLVADQSPSFPDKGIWTPFFGRPTPFAKGPENGAVHNNLPVIFCYIERLKRGYYKGHFLLAEEDPASLPKGELTRRYVRFLEEHMRAQPENWLWTHRRWKWDWKPEYGEIL